MLRVRRVLFHAQTPMRLTGTPSTISVHLVPYTHRRKSPRCRSEKTMSLREDSRTGIFWLSAVDCVVVDVCVHMHTCVWVIYMHARVRVELVHVRVCASSCSPPCPCCENAHLEMRVSCT